MSKKNLRQIANKFQKQCQKIIDDSNGNITSVSIKIGAKTHTVAKQVPDESPTTPKNPPC